MVSIPHKYCLYRKLFILNFSFEPIDLIEGYQEFLETQYVLSAEAIKIGGVEEEECILNHGGTLIGFFLQ